MKPASEVPAASAGPSPSTAPGGGVVVPMQARWHGRLAARIIWGLCHLLAWTLRWRMEDRAGMQASDAARPVIFAIWHNRLALSLLIHRRYVQRPHDPQPRRLAALVSASRDGGLLARVLELFHVIPIRGSSSRRGAPALREIIAAAQAGHDVALTPDGPRGPCYRLQPGVIAAAQLTGLPIVPASFHLPWKKCLRSWDRFQIPLPFSRCEVVFGAPIRIPPDATEADRERLRVEVEAALRSITRD